MVIVPLDSPSCEVRLNDPESGGFIGTLPDRLHFCKNLFLSTINFIFCNDAFDDEVRG
jgi:hypothetical protein